jgi:MiaB-like tRNA modifying enzyme
MNTKRIFIKSYGCSTNQAEGEVIQGCLAEAGFEIVQSENEADVLLYNCCAVKGPTEDRMFDVLKRVPRGKRLVVAGCLPIICHDRLSREVNFDSAIGPNSGSIVVEAVSRTLLGQRFLALGECLSMKPSLQLPRIRSNPVISVVPISCGCMGSCAYCCVVFARGRLRSCSPEEIVSRIREDFASGAREFWLTSQDTGCYGKDIGSNLARLLKTICSVPEDFRIRVGMMTPNFANDMLDELIEAFRDPKVFKFLHLPIQSGDNSILKRMRRGYTVEDFGNIVKTFRKEFPLITLSTDVICGFPGETREAFAETLHVLEKYKPDIVNVSRFFARPRTAAAQMLDTVPTEEIRRRSIKVSQLAKRIALARNKSWINWTGEILVDEKGKKSGSWIGRNYAYKPVVVKNSQDLIGKTVQVIVSEAFPTYLSAEFC